jgi:hypothetical protein
MTGDGGQAQTEFSICCENSEQFRVFDAATPTPKFLVAGFCRAVFPDTFTLGGFWLVWRDEVAEFFIFALSFFCIFMMLHNSSCHRGKSGATTPSAQADANPPPALARPEKAPETPARPFDPFPARRENVTETIHGQSVQDPYRWMEDASRPDVRQWLERQDAYTQQFLSKLPDREAMARRLAELSYVEWVGPPVRQGNRYSFRVVTPTGKKPSTTGRKAYRGRRACCWIPIRLAPDGSIAVKGVFPSLDGKTAAYLVSVNNADHATLRVMDVATGKLYEKDVIDGAAMPIFLGQNRKRPLLYAHSHRSIHSRHGSAGTCRCVLSPPGHRSEGRPPGARKNG